MSIKAVHGTAARLRICLSRKASVGRRPETVNVRRPGRGSVDQIDLFQRRVQMEEEPKTIDRLDALLGKYVSVWIWSILTGVTVSVGISFTSVRPSARGLFGMVLVFPVLLGFAATYAGLVHLLNYLRRHIIPVFLQSPTENVGYPTREERHAPAHHLFVALRYLIYAVALRLIAGALEIAFNSLAF